MKKVNEISPEKLKEVADEATNRLSAYLKHNKEHPEKEGFRRQKKKNIYELPLACMIHRPFIIFFAYL